MISFIQDSVTEIITFKKKQSADASVIVMSKNKKSHADFSDSRSWVPSVESD